MKISYSKAQAFKTCKRKYKYAHVDMYEPDSDKPGLMPNEKSHALSLGSHGHAVMEQFFKPFLTKDYPYSMADINESQNAAIGWGMQENMSLQMEINTQLIHFFLNVFPHKGWRVIAVEETMILPLGTDSTGEKRIFPFTADLLVEVGGKLAIVDHKFAADAYMEERIAIEPQLPLYIGASRALGRQVSYGIYNFMRTRKMKNVGDQVVQADVRPNMQRIKAAFTEHLETYTEILAYEAKPLEKQAWPRNVNNNCNYCDFNKLCGIELRGDDSTLYRKTSFTANDYGYELATGAKIEDL